MTNQSWNLIPQLYTQIIRCNKEHWNGADHKQNKPNLRIEQDRNPHSAGLCMVSMICTVPLCTIRNTGAKPLQHSFGDGKHTQIVWCMSLRLGKPHASIWRSHYDWLYHVWAYWTLGRYCFFDGVGDLNVTVMLLIAIYHKHLQVYSYICTYDPWYSGRYCASKSGANRN